MKVPFELFSVFTDWQHSKSYVVEVQPPFRDDIRKFIEDAIREKEKP